MPDKRPKKPSQKPASEFPDALTLFKPSWQALRLNLGTFLLQSLLPVGLGVVTALLVGAYNRAPSDGQAVVATLAFFATFVAALFMFVTLIVTQFKSAQGHKIGMRSVIHTTRPFFWRLLGLFLLTGLITVVGFVLLVVPGMFALQRLLLAPYFLVDKNLGIIESMKQSYATAKNKSFASALWGVTWVIVAINLLSFIPSIVTMTVSTILMILYICAPAIRYVQIAKHASTAVKA
ncbi:MAG TPA: YciC family protein [Candidatus Saccharimonadales bacterium]|nr:YciC family protein [Candidatus Saccharimonadales bacterium]